MTSKVKSLFSPRSETWERRQRIWKHTSFLGHCAMIRSQMRAIEQADTTTDLAKTLARQISDMAYQLSVALKDRKDG